MASDCHLNIVQGVDPSNFYGFTSTALFPMLFYHLHFWSGLLGLPSTSQTSDICFPDRVDASHLQLTTDLVKTLSLLLNHCHDALQQSLHVCYVFWNSY
jgi:hypothetical protein